MADQGWRGLPKRIRPSLPRYCLACGRLWSRCRRPRRSRIRRLLL